MAKQKTKKKKTKKKAASATRKKKTAIQKEPIVVKCPICNGNGTLYEPIGWGDSPDDNVCLLCGGDGEVLERVLENQDAVPCPDCEQTGKGHVPFWGDSDDAFSCLKCDGSGNILRVQLDTELKRERWEQRTAKLPTKEERDLADYLITVLPITLDQADKMVCSLVSAVNARNNYEKSWLEYEG